jgi:hypothetical protein
MTAKRRTSRLAGTRLGRARLDEMVEEATVDCYGESEQTNGLFTKIEESLALPFETTVLGVVVNVVRIDQNDRDEIVAICRRGRDRQAVWILDLPLPSPRPAGWEWIEAYRHWVREGRSGDGLF